MVHGSSTRRPESKRHTSNSSSVDASFTPPILYETHPRRNLLPRPHPRNHQGGCSVSPQKQRGWRPNRQQSRDGSATFLALPGLRSQYVIHESFGLALNAAHPRLRLEP